ncbi:MAG TPA: four-carbon acid sugar kinase family protein [Puia sp.]|nr:four-carbon acid sugar kinase family protein [Puia sp.]
MIAVIADDLTGAAELGGIGLRHGLRTEVRMRVGGGLVPGGSGAGDGPDLLVIAGDSRSKSEAAAVEEMSTITRQIQELQPEWIFKKTDSVLRGHVMAELRVHLDILQLPSALLVPANPALGRTIRAGHYYLNGRPIHHSAFSIDPEFPILSPDVQDMLHTRSRPVELRRVEEELPERGIVVGEVQDANDLRVWARRLRPGMLAAGAAGFFSALLDRNFPMMAQEAINGHVFGSPLLFVSGSTFDRSRNAIARQRESGGPVSYIPVQPGGSWQELVAGMLQKRGKAIVAIDPAIHDRSAVELRTMMATAVSGIIKQARPAEIIIEGGATAYAIFEATGWQTFVPEQELAPGLIRMRVGEAPGLFVTVKPGSYPWPDTITY